MGETSARTWDRGQVWRETDLSMVCHRVSFDRALISRCMNFHIERLDHRCHGCNWALYCSIECQQADWMRQGGHQSECSAEYTPSATV